MKKALIGSPKPISAIGYSDLATVTTCHFLIIDPKQTSFVKSLFSVLSINLTYVDEER